MNKFDDIYISNEIYRVNIIFFFYKGLKIILRNIVPISRKIRQKFFNFSFQT